MKNKIFKIILFIFIIRLYITLFNFIFRVSTIIAPEKFCNLLYSSKTDLSCRSSAPSLSENSSFFLFSNIIQYYLKVLLQASLVDFFVFIIIYRYSKLLNIIWILLPILLPTFEREYNLWKCWNKLNREVLLFVDI